jgi:hypothetical protein
LACTEYKSQRKMNGRLSDKIKRHNEERRRWRFGGCRFLDSSL